MSSLCLAGLISDGRGTGWRALQPAPIRCTRLFRPPLMRLCTPLPYGAAALSAGAHTNPQHASKMPGSGVPRPRPGIIRRAQPLLTCPAAPHLPSPSFCSLQNPLGFLPGLGLPATAPPVRCSVSACLFCSSNLYSFIAKIMRAALLMALLIR